MSDAANVLGRLAVTLAVTLMLSACASGAGEPDGRTTSADGAPAETVADPPADRPDGDDTAVEEQEPGQPRFDEAQVLAVGLDTPWSIAFHDRAPLISERDTARILELAPDGSAREVGTVEGVVSSGESGLLGLAVGPDARLYVYSTGQDGNRIQRFELQGEPGGLRLGSVETIVEGIPASSTHNGGRLAFGPDGMLYASTGDAQDQPSAQDLDSLGGKILRMSPDGEAPEDNPFPDSLVYSLGHRNVQGIAWADDGTMYASEFGQNTWDELNVIEAGGNFGWPEVEGAGGGDDYLDPIVQWEPREASPSGIAVHGDTVYVAGLRGQRLLAVDRNDPADFTEHWSGEFGRLRDVVLAPDGALWVLTNNTDGRGSPGPDDDRVLRIPVR
ncbi:PQQ-dependent sugar dehydrogenase [Brevibacterium daeguense]|uniref:PQQ-dependent sugar dehydrogenase n=1 Tax=Brevibacterium daeguense TaxID=909936 RepID=A0ABP8ELJ1_9MICO|nr:PQQ-dependent sugar dehydrogenase [Brevibacterium daeguense]